MPVAGDAVTIEGGFTVTVDINNAACASVQVGGLVAGNGTLLFAASSQLTVSGSVILGNGGVRTGSLNFASGGLLQIGAALTVTTIGTFTPGTGTIEYNGAGAQTVATTAALGSAYNNLTLSNAGAKTTAGVTANGVLSMAGTATASVAPTYGAAATLQYNTATARNAGVEWSTPFVGTGGVIIANTGTITLTIAKVFNASVPLTINSGAALATGNFQLTFGGNFVNNGGTFTAGSSPIVIANTAAAQSIAGFTTTGLVSMTKTLGTATFTGNVNGAGFTLTGLGGTLDLGTGFTHTFSGAWTRTNGTLLGNSSTLNIGGSVVGAGGTFTAGTSTVNWNAAGAQTVAGVTYYHLSLSNSGAKTLGAATAVNGNLTISGTATLADGGFQITGNGTGTLSVAAGAALQIGAGGATTETFPTLYPTANITLAATSTVIYNSTGAMTVAGSVTGVGPSTYGHLTVSGASIKTAASAITVAGNLTINAGTLADGGFQITGNGTGTMTMAAGTGLTLGSVATATSFPTNFIAANITLNATSTVTYNSNQPQTISSVPTYGHVTLTATGAVTKTLDGALSLNGNLTIGLNNTLSVSGSNFPIGIKGNWTNNSAAAAFSAGTGTVTFSGAGAQALGGTSATTFNNLTFSTSGTKTLGIATTANGTLTINNGVTFASNTFLVTFGGDFTNLGTFTSTTGGVTIAGTATQGIDGFTTTGTVTMTKTAGTATLHGNVNGAAFTLTGLGGTLDLGAGLTHTFTGAWTRTNGTLLGNSSTLKIGGTTTNTAGTFTAGTSTVNYNGGAAQTIANVTYNNLTLSNAGVKTTTGATVSGVLSMEGTATASAAPVYAAAATLQYNTATARAAGVEWITPFAATGGVVIANTGAITTGVAKVFNAGVPLTINSGATLIANTFLVTLGGDFNNLGGTFTSTTGGVTIAGTAATQGIDGFTTTGTITLTKTAGTATLHGNVNGVALTINGGGGTLDLGSGLTHTFTDIVTLTAGTLNGGSSTLNENMVSVNAWNGTGTVFSAGTGTVNFGAAGAQTLSATTTTFNNLTFSTSGTKTLGPATNVNGTLTINNSVTLDASTFLLTLGGDFSNSGAFTAGTSTVNLSGSGAQAIGGTTTTAFNNLTISNTSASISANTNFNVAGTLTVNASAVLSPAAAVIVGGAGTLTGSGVVRVTSATGTNDFGVQYSITGKTLTNLTVDYSVSGQGLTNTTYGGLKISGFVTGASNSATVGGVFTATGTFTPTSGTITMNNGSSIVSSGTLTFYGLTIAASASVSTSLSFPVSNTLTIGAGATFTTTGTITVNGNVANSGSQTGAGLILLSGGAAPHALSGGGSYTNLQLNDSQGATLSAALPINGTLTLTTGTITTGVNSVTINSGASVSRTGGYVVGNLAKYVSIGSPPLTFEVGDATSYVPAVISFAGVSVAGTLTVSTTSGDHTNIATSIIDPSHSVNRYWTLTNGAITFTTCDVVFNFVLGDIDGGSVPSTFFAERYSGAAWTMPTTGTRTGTSTQVTGLTPSAFSGDFQIGQLSGGTFTSTGSGNWNTPGTWDLGVVPVANADVVIASGMTVSIDVNTANLKTVTIQSTAILQGSGSFTLSLGASGGTDFSNAGTFTANGVTVNLNKSSQWAGSGTFNLYNIDLNSNTLTLAFGSANTVHLSAAGDPISNPGTLVPGANSTVDYSGTSAQTVSGSGTVNFNNLQINNSSSVTLASVITGTKVAGSLSVLAGTFDNGGYAITLANNQSFSVANGATFQLSSTSTMVAVSGSGTKTFGAASTVNYAGSAQIVTNEAYGKLTLSGSGAKTLPASSVTVAGTFTMSGTASATAGAAFAFNGDVVLTSGTFDGGSFTHTVAGNWTNNGGTYTPSTSTVLFSSGSAQSIGGSSGTTFNNLQFSGVGLKSIGSALTVNASLTVNSGAPVTLTSSGAVNVSGDIVNNGILTNGGTITVQ